MSVCTGQPAPCLGSKDLYRNRSRCWDGSAPRQRGLRGGSAPAPADIAGNVVGQELQGDKAAQAGILGLVDDAHAAAAAELFNDSVVGDGLANHPGNAWLSGRFILRTRYRYVNEW